MTKSEDIQEYNDLRKALVWAGTKDQISTIQAEMRVYESKYTLEELIGSHLAVIYKKHGKIPSQRG